MKEYDWQIRVVELAKLCGWRHAHFRPLHTTKGWRTPQSGDAGFPDLVLVHPAKKRVIFAELKVDSPVRPDQKEWLEALGSVQGVETYLWRPPDWDAVLDILR